MASIGRITTSAVSIPTELTVAAAAFNIDFSLLKLEAPASFHGVRDALSTKRRGDAEGGLPHMTARRLGALFDAHIPKIPNLIDAYGTRVSEICSTLDDNNKSRPDAGIFKAQAGPDGTTIWAGATSGSAALAVHLLACLLAKIWKSHEAISLWVELVERRKQEIQSTYTGGNPTELTSMMAAQQIITREHLAAWDSSARSWLRTGDAAKRRQQTQLTLIINNLSMPVNASTDPYESVMKAWLSALKTMERLVQGIPQRIQDGAILLAISSWHLYPDMQILVDEVKRVDQGDPLMRGSVITVSKSTFCSGKEGVIWSLPLSRMRFYHPPETTERRMASDTSRITINEFWIVILGAIVGTSLDGDSDIRETCQLIDLVNRLVQPTLTGLRWLEYLSKAALRYLEVMDVEKQQVAKLFSLGRRRGLKFLSLTSPLLPQLFNIADFLALIDVGDDYRSPGKGPTKQISILRHVAQGLDANAQDLIIRYRVQPADGSNAPAWEFASALPVQRKTSKRTANEDFKPVFGHVRWVTANVAKPMGSCEGRGCACVSVSSRGCFCELMDLKCTEYCHRDSERCTNFASANPFQCRNLKTMLDQSPARSPTPVGNEVLNHAAALARQGDGDVLDNDWLETQVLASLTETRRQSGDRQDDQRQDASCALRPYCPGCCNNRAKESVEAGGESCQLIIPDDILPIDAAHFRLTTPSHPDSTTFELLFGDSASVALFKREGVKVHRKYEPCQGDGEVGGEALTSSSPAILRELDIILADADLNRDKLHNHLAARVVDLAAIPALEFATTLYKDMDDPTINLEILNLNLSDAHWVKSLRRGSRRLKRDSTDDSNEHNREWTLRHNTSVRFIKADDELPSVFACLAMFDSGHYDIILSSLKGVFALSSGDSIYVALSMLTDPAKRVHPQGYVRRVFGNLGRTGMSFLMCPSEPRLNPHSLKSWQMVNHCRFDKEFQNSFTGTSLHLSYTDYEMPIDLGTHGLRDNQAVLVEAVITLDDKGNRLGDLDIGPLIMEPLHHFLPRCSHDNVKDEKPLDSQQYGVLSKLISIDCWDELFEFPDRMGVFRATGSWEARAAGLAASLQMKKKVLVLPESPCLDCLAEFLVISDPRKKCDVIIA